MVGELRDCRSLSILAVFGGIGTGPRRKSGSEPGQFPMLSEFSWKFPSVTIGGTASLSCRQCAPPPALRGVCAGLNSAVIRNQKYVRQVNSCEQIGCVLSRHISEQSMSETSENELSTDAVDMLNNAWGSLQNQIRKVIVGQDDVIEQILIALFSRGHVLLEGVPGLAKTLMISTVARSLSMSFSRIQFTPDLMPADITGTDILQENRSTGEREFRFIPGPLFHNVVLADEINRTPPKTQAALLEAMQERQVTVGQTIHPLSSPFFVLATQNPIEQEGTYTLPEAQQDRFMFKVFVRYPTFEEERAIARQTTSNASADVATVLSGEDVMKIQETVRRVQVSDHVINYCLALVRQTRVGEPGVPEWVNEMLGWGAGPRAVQNLLVGGKTRALLNGRTNVSLEDIQKLAAPVLRHRIVPNFTAESEGVTSDHLIERLIQETTTDESELTRDPALGKIFAA